jgi:hypothetical protein
MHAMVRGRVREGAHSTVWEGEGVEGGGCGRGHIARCGRGRVREGAHSTVWEGEGAGGCGT